MCIRDRARPLGADEEVVETADRRQLARHRRRSRPLGREPGPVAPHVAVANVADPQALAVSPLDELTQVDAIGMAGALGQVPGTEITIKECERLSPVHEE